MVVLIGAILAYTATRQATSVSERQALLATQAEVRRTAELAEGLYSDLLIAIETANVAATGMWANIDGSLDQAAEGVTGRIGLTEWYDLLRSLETSDKFTSRLAFDRRLLADGLMAVDVALRRIAGNSFALTCYRNKWTSLGENLRSRTISAALASYDRNMVDDPVRASRLVPVAASRLRIDTGSEASPRAEEEAFLMAQLGTDDLEQNGNQRLSNAYRVLVFLGNTVGLQQTGDSVLFIGMALLSDVMRSVPNSRDIAACLSAHYPNLEVDGRDASVVVDSANPLDVVYESRMDPEDVTLALTRDLTELEKRGFRYVATPDSYRRP